MQNKRSSVKQGERVERLKEMEVGLKSWSCSHINCEIASSNPILSSLSPLALSISRLHNPDKLSPGPSSLEKYIENLSFATGWKEIYLYGNAISLRIPKNNKIYTQSINHQLPTVIPLHKSSWKENAS